jgi:outer membrane protein assembly factor BamE (lipoprotein component of BamABCDE complex)
MAHRSRSYAAWGVLSLAFVLFLSGCAVRLGTPFKTDQVQSIIVGTTTQAQIVEFFGQPASKGLKDGRPLWTYLFARLALMGGAATGTVLSVEFNDQGRVHSYSYVPY